MKRMKKVAIIFMTCVLMAGITYVPSVNVQAAKKTSVTKKMMKKSLKGQIISVTVDDEEQRFVAEPSEIKKIKVKSKKYSKNHKKAKIVAYAYFDRDVAVVKTKTVLKYKLVKKKWKLVSLKLGQSSISSIRIKGTWEGIYSLEQGETKAKIIIDKVTKGGKASGIFCFSALPTNPNVPTGLFYISGGYELKTGKIGFLAGEWIEQPYGYQKMDFSGYVDLRCKCLRSKDYSAVMFRVK